MENSDSFVFTPSKLKSKSNRASSPGTRARPENKDSYEAAMVSDKPQRNKTPENRRRKLSQEQRITGSEHFPGIVNKKAIQPNFFGSQSYEKIPKLKKIQQPGGQLMIKAQEGDPSSSRMKAPRETQKEENVTPKKSNEKKDHYKDFINTLEKAANVPHFLLQNSCKLFDDMEREVDFVLATNASLMEDFENLKEQRKLRKQAQRENRLNKLYYKK